ncbi:MAG: hypothetical protein JWM07_892 [Candidatus Saccharibacteria bacterium]|nr:hypothetical protein [Candidatus Saccharibacteria bacterium]
MEEVPIDETPIDDEAIDDKKPILPAWLKYIFIALGIGAIVMYLIASGWGGYAYMYAKCGVQQPLIASTAPSGQVFYPPDNRRYSAPGEGAFFKGYYCTEAQAKEDGFLRAAP